ncbi:GNAT family N-acetyltransferase [Paenibacillus sp. FSL K6-3182]|uniref:GNAT family N-acetyltransferase n=1 Tax=Paenibacillus sp. FSL K6-3182 TaxID=2921495 RepID=UPI0030D245FF
MFAHYRKCQSDEDYAQFTLYFIRNRKEFSRQFSLGDALFHVLESIHDSEILLIFDKNEQLIGWGHYRYVNAKYEYDPEGDIVFINSVIVLPSYRSSSLFSQGFRYMLNQIAAENSSVKFVQFHAQIDNAYLNRLYSKFSSVIRQREGYYGMENVYSVDFGQLHDYLSAKQSRTYR